MRSDLALVRHVNTVAKRKGLHQGGGEKLLACKWDEFKVTDEDLTRSPALKSLVDLKFVDNNNNNNNSNSGTTATTDATTGNSTSAVTSRASASAISVPDRAESFTSTTSTSNTNRDVDRDILDAPLFLPVAPMAMVVPAGTHHSQQ